MATLKSAHSRKDIIRDCGVSAGRFDREHGNPQKTRAAYCSVVDEFLDGHKWAADLFDSRGYQFSRLASESYRVYLRHFNRKNTP